MLPVTSHLLYWLPWRLYMVSPAHRWIKARHIPHRILILQSVAGHQYKEGRQKKAPHLLVLAKRAFLNIPKTNNSPRS